MGYFVVLWFLRLSMFPAGSADDAEQLFFAQSFELGYKVGQPPLYTWIIWIAEQILGTSLGLVVGIKYALIVLVHGLAFELARRLTNSVHWGAFTSISLFGIYYLAWDSVLNYSQTVLVVALAFAGVLAARTLIWKGTPASVIALGLTVGIGIMTKYNFALFAIALTSAVLFDARGRAALKGRGALLFLGSALLISIPHLAWLASASVDGGDFARAVPKMSIAGDDGGTLGSFLASRGAGLLDVLEAIVSILMPFLVVWLVFFPGAVRKIGPAAGDDVIFSLRLMERTFGLFILLLLILVLVVGMSEVRNHWFVVLAPFVAYATSRTAIVYGDPSSRRANGFAATMAFFAVAVMVGLTARSVKELADCDKCKMMVPYEQLASALTEAGFRHGTVFAMDWPLQITGNLRPLLPGARFESGYFPDYRPPASAMAGLCVAVWREGHSMYPTAIGMTAEMKQRFGATFTANETPVFRIDVPVSNDVNVPYAFMLMNSPDHSGRCR